MCSLSDLFLWAVLPSIINTLWEVLDEADALSYADLFLLRQLGGQTGLTRCGMVHGHVSLLLVTDKKQKNKTSTSTLNKNPLTSLTNSLCLLKVVWPVRLCTGINWEIKQLSSLDDLDRPVSGNDSKTRLFTELYCWLYWTRRFIKEATGMTLTDTNTLPTACKYLGFCMIIRMTTAWAKNIFLNQPGSCVSSSLSPGTEAVAPGLDLSRPRNSPCLTGIHEAERCRPTSETWDSCPYLRVSSPVLSDVKNQIFVAKVSLGG